MADVERCKKCRFWRGANGKNAALGMRFCNHLLDTNTRRVEDENGVCLSFKPRGKFRKEPPRPMRSQFDTI